MTLRRRVLIFGLAILVPLAALLFMGVWRERQQALSLARDAALRSVRGASGAHERVLGETTRLLTLLAALPEVRAEDWPATSALLARVMQQNPDYTNLRVNDPTGTPLASALPAGPGSSYRDTPWFRRAVEASGFTLGDYFTGFVSGKPGVAVTLPVRSADGRVRYVLSATIGAGAFRHFAPADFPQGSTFSVLDRAGTFVVREPDPEHRVGTQVPDGELLRAFGSETSEGIVEAPGADGVARVYAYRALRVAPGHSALYVAVGIPKSRIVAPANRTLTATVAAIVAALAFLMGAVVVGARRLLLDPLATLVGVTEGVSAGRLEVAAPDSLRKHSSEFGQLADALDDMIGRLRRQAAERARAEQALRASEQRLALVVEGTQDGVWDHDLMTGEVYVSARYGQLLGYEPDELQPDFEPWLLLAHPDDLNAARDAMRRHLEEGAPYDTEMRLRTTAGGYRWFRARARAMRNEAGVPVRIAGSISDITDRKRAEAALRESEAHLEEAQRIAGVGSWSWDARTDTATWSKQLCLMLDVDPAMRAPTMVEQQALYSAESVRRMRSAVDRTMRTGEPYVIEMERVRQNGTSTWLLARGEALFDDERRVVGLRGTALDITERKSAEMELRRFKATLDQTSDCVFMFQPDSLRFFYVNQGAVDQVGYTAEELYAMTPLDIKPEYDERRLRELFEPLKTGDRSAVTFETVHRRKDGSDVPVEVVVQYFGPAGEPARFIAIVRDITERKRTERRLIDINVTLDQRVRERTAQLEATNRELEAFSYSVSHDLRAPLRGIDGFSQALLEEYADRLDETGVEYLTRVREGTRRMGALIDDMMRLSRVARGELRLERVDLSAVARQVVSELAEADPARQVAVTIEPGPAVIGDRRLLRAALRNLLNNAWKFTRQQPHPIIEFGTVGAAPEPIFYVRDNGAGFDMTYADKLFGAFQRLHATHEFEGNGIGLATVQRIIRRHGGRVWAEGAVGRGATFHFTVPVAGEGER